MPDGPHPWPSDGAYGYGMGPGPHQGHQDYQSHNYQSSHRYDQAYLGHYPLHQNQPHLAHGQHPAQVHRQPPIALHHPAEPMRPPPGVAEHQHHHQRHPGGLYQASLVPQSQPAPASDPATGPGPGPGTGPVEANVPAHAQAQSQTQTPAGPVSPQVKVRRSRASRACENCRKRKVRCSGGDVCNECQRFGEQCVYREHYRAKREFSVKILRSPDFDKEHKRPASTHSDEPPSMVRKRRPASNEAALAAGHCITDQKMRKLGHLLVGDGDGLGLSDTSPSPPPEELPPRARDLGHTLMSAASCNRHQVSPESAPVDRHLTEEQMLQCLQRYADLVHPSTHLIDLDLWTKKAKRVFRAIEYDAPIDLSDLELAMVYVLIALGLTSSVSTTSRFAGYTTYEWTIEYMNKCRTMLSDVLEQEPSVLLAQCVVQYALCKLMNRQTRACYVYCGILGKIFNELNLRNVDFSNPEHHEVQRTWMAASIVEQHSATILGRPMVHTLVLPQPEPDEFPSGPLAYQFRNIVANLHFNRVASTALSDMIQQPISSLEELPKALEKCKVAAAAAVAALQDAGVDPEKGFSEVTDQESVQRLLMTLTNRMTQLCLFRPFLLLHVALADDLVTTAKPDPAIAAAQQGAQVCVRNALAILELIQTAATDRFGADWVVDFHFGRPVVLLVYYSMALATRLKVANSQELRDEHDTIVNAVNKTFNLVSKVLDSHETDMIRAVLAAFADDDVRTSRTVRRYFSAAFVPEQPSVSNTIFADNLSSREEIVQYWKRCVDGTLISH